MCNESEGMRVQFFSTEVRKKLAPVPILKTVGQQTCSTCRTGNLYPLVRPVEGHRSSLSLGSRRYTLGYCVVILIKFVVKVIDRLSFYEEELLSPRGLGIIGRR